MFARQVSILILLLSLSFVERIAGQTSKVAIINLDSLRSQSIFGEWELIKEWERQGIEMVTALQKKYLQIQVEIEQLCFSSKTLEELQMLIQEQQEQILDFERKVMAAKDIFSKEINTFLLQQVMLLLPDLKSHLDIDTLSTSTPVYVDRKLERELVYITSWFLQEFNNRPAILENWMSFCQNLLERIEKGRWY
ncbi:MAG: hypothetical protein KTR30_20830 [Saprospiraceae bacterium]|nr:hypothetical protein [Saprospiraceae bacterium]